MASDRSRTILALLLLMALRLAWRHHEAGPVSYRRARLSLAGSLDVDAVRTRIPFDMLVLGFQYRFAG